MTEQRSPSEDRLLRFVRVASAVVILTCIVLLVVADTFGRLLFNPDFHASEIIFGTLVGALLALIGVETLIRLPKKGDPR